MAHNCYYVYFYSNNAYYIDLTKNTLTESMKSKLNRGLQLYCASKQLDLENCTNKIVGMIADECNFTPALNDYKISATSNLGCANGIATQYGWYRSAPNIYCPIKAE